MAPGAVSVSVKGPGTYLVEVRHGRARTTHTVEVPEGLSAELGWGEDGEEELVHQSFFFLLEREPPDSILRHFRLDVIGSYFPEYEQEIRR